MIAIQTQILGTDSVQNDQEYIWRAIGRQMRFDTSARTGHNARSHTFTAASAATVDAVLSNKSLVEGAIRWCYQPEHFLISSSQTIV